MNPSSTAKPRVLVADDEIAIADTLRVILRQHGYEAKAVYGGKPAIEAAMEWRPDLFLADVMMPDMDGIEAAIQIRKILPACKVLLFSGKAVVHDLITDAHQLGYDFQLLLKPVHPRDLLEHLRGLLDES
jgi:CheY-like chemotaxis protein